MLHLEIREVAGSSPVLGNAAQVDQMDRSPDFYTGMH